MYIRTLQIWYNYKLEQRQQIITKLKYQVMRVFNIKVGNTQGQTKLVHNPYKDSLNNILDSNIEDIGPKIVYTKLESRQSILII